MNQLFSYGTLQQQEVQISTFGRTLTGQPDSIIGYIVAVIDIADPEMIRISGRSRHPILRYTGLARHHVPGTVFELSTAELRLADAYEVASYQRVEASLVMGGKAWAYVERSAQE